MTIHKSQERLGFRDIRDFNLTLLSKQRWRLIIHPLSLMGRLFQARYYPGSQFLEARLGYN